MAESYTMTPAPALHSVSASQPGPIDGGDGKEWLAAPLENSNGTIDQPLSRTATNSTRHRNARWWKIRLFRGMKKDIRRRAPFYWSDWKDAWDYRVVPATVYMYFAKYAVHCELLHPSSPCDPFLLTFHPLLHPFFSQPYALILLLAIDLAC